MIDTFKALPALFTPVLLLVGIYTGVMTPTEAGAVAAAYTLLISVFVYSAISSGVFPILVKYSFSFIIQGNTIEITNLPI